MKAWIDPANRAHFLDGNPHFVLGIYDTTQIFATRRLTTCRSSPRSRWRRST